jgi:hypothetical protein
MPDDAYTVPRMDPHQIRNERLRIASDLLALALRDVAVLPTKQQEQVRLAMKALVDVQQWCKAHRPGGGPS